MVTDPASRRMVMGNSGSGKSALAARIGTSPHLPIHDLDLVHWHADGRRRAGAEARARVAEIAAENAWVIEGVYGWLAKVALMRATTLVWLDLPWAECRAGLLARGLRRGMTPNDREALLAWAEACWTRDTPSSFTGHGQLYRRFEGSKAHLRTRAEVVAFQRRGWKVG